MRGGLKLLLLVIVCLCTFRSGQTYFTKCQRDLNKSLKPYNNDEKFPDAIYCCALSTFRSCVVDVIEKDYQPAPENIIDEIISVAVKKFKPKIGTICYGNEFYYHKESTLCAGDTYVFWGNVIGIIAVVIIFLVLCCMCCKVWFNVKSRSPSSEPAPVPRTIVANAEEPCSSTKV